MRNLTRIGSFAALALAACVCSAQNINVKELGAKGDGVTDDTAAIQRALDTAKHGQVVELPAGTYAITMLNVKAGTTIEGHNATLLCLPGRPKFSRMITTYKAGYTYSGLSDSPQLRITGITFDGNRDNMGPYTHYQQEQNAELFLGADPHSPGRLNAWIEDCVFKDSVADGINVYTNTYVQVYHCQMVNCFRGGVTATGGDSTIKMSYVDTSGTTSLGFHGEVEGTGYTGKGITVELSHVRCYDAIHLGLLAGSHVLCTDCDFRGYFTGTMTESTATFQNCDFHSSGYAPDGSAGYLINPGNTTFNNCHFTFLENANPSAKLACLYVIWQTRYRPAQHQRLTIENCTFEGQNAPTSNTFAVVATAPGTDADDNVLIVRNSRIDNRFGTGISMPNGGKAQVSGLTNQALHPVQGARIIHGFGG